jgi:hypothetical protein
MLNYSMYIYFLQISATKAVSSLLFVHFQDKLSRELVLLHYVV